MKFYISISTIFLSLFFYSCSNDETATGPVTVPKFSERLYSFYVPDNLNPQKNNVYNPNLTANLLIVFHGSGGTGDWIRQQTRLDYYADSTNSIIVYPTAIKGDWNDRFEDDNIHYFNDIGFTNYLIDLFISKYPTISPDRVYAAGFSNGAFFCHFLGMNLNNKIKAIIPVCGMIDPYHISTSTNQNPVSVMQIAAKDDKVIPFEGFNSNYQKILSAVSTMDYWAKRNYTSSIIITSPYPDLIPLFSVIKKEYIPESGSKIRTVLFELDGSGHSWPMNPEFNVSSEIMRYIKSLQNK